MRVGLGFLLLTLCSVSGLETCAPGLTPLNVCLPALDPDPGNDPGTAFPPAVPPPALDTPVPATGFPAAAALPKTTP